MGKAQLREHKRNKRANNKSQKENKTKGHDCEYFVIKKMEASKNEREIQVKETLQKNINQREVK